MLINSLTSYRRRQGRRAVLPEHPSANRPVIVFPVPVCTAQRHRLRHHRNDTDPGQPNESEIHGPRRLHQRDTRSVSSQHFNSLIY